VAKSRGADVTLIAANVNTSSEFGMSVIHVENTQQLQTALQNEFDHCDALIMAAAVSDARPDAFSGKVKKENLKSIELTQNPDLLADISKQKSHQMLVGFAAEEHANLLQEGQRKFHSKGLDLIYANDISDGSIFGSDKTTGYLIDSQGHTHFENISKQTLALRLLDKVAERLNSANV
jgi:phosphopantothenoylcysteine decarboxylase/phosphopantothenate--cysteine ligase